MAFQWLWDCLVTVPCVFVIWPIEFRLLYHQFAFISPHNVNATETG
jgi:hypothetical protein